MQSSQALDKPLQMAIEWTEILIILKNTLPPKKWIFIYPLKISVVALKSNLQELF